MWYNTSHQLTNPHIIKMNTVDSKCIMKEDIRFNDLVGIIDYLDQEEGKSLEEIIEYVTTRYNIPKSVTKLELLIMELMDDE